MYFKPFYTYGMSIQLDTRSIVGIVQCIERSLCVFVVVVFVLENSAYTDEMVHSAGSEFFTVRQSTGYWPPVNNVLRERGILPGVKTAISVGAISSKGSSLQ